MVRTYLFAVCLFAALAVAANAATPLDVKPGTWEHTVTVQMSGVPPIPPEVLAKMTPEQKAMMESRFKQTPKTTTNRHCLSKEDLAKALDLGETKGTCQRTVVSSSAHSEEIRAECAIANTKSIETIKVEALDSEHLKFTAFIVGGDGSNTMKINVSGTGKWLGSSCETNKK